MSTENATEVKREYERIELLTLHETEYAEAFKQLNGKWPKFVPMFGQAPAHVWPKDHPAPEHVEDRCWRPWYGPFNTKKDLEG